MQLAEPVTALCPKTESASDRAGCRARSSSLGGHPGPSRRTFEPFRLPLMSVAGQVVLGDENAVEQQLERQAEGALPRMARKLEPHLSRSIAEVSEDNEPSQELGNAT